MEMEIFHELNPTGSGYVENVGPKVTVAKPGDPVLLSFASCGECQICQSGHPSHCIKAKDVNFVGSKCFCDSASGSSPEQPNQLGSFFGQSSFASLTIANETSVVN